METDFDVASVGECMLELSSRNDGGWAMNFAGDAFNTLWTLRALLGDASRCDFITAFGDDPFSRDQNEFFQRHGIGVAQSPIVPGARPGLYAITLDGAERSFTYWRNQSAARQLASDRQALRRSLEGRALVYFSGITLAILSPADRDVLFDILRQVRSERCRIAFDPNYRPRLWASRSEAQAATEEALSLTDIALPTFPDQRELFADVSPAETALSMRRAGAGEVVVKNGAEPAVAAHLDQVDSIPAGTVPDPLDTTGAGDAFNGAYLAARLLGADVAIAVRKAHRVAAAVVQVRGALAPKEKLQRAFAGPPFKAA